MNLTTYDTEGLPSIPSGLPGNVYDKRGRTLWRTAQVRASDLRIYDVIRHLGAWLEVLDVYHDVEDADEVAENYEQYNPQLAAQIRARLDSAFQLWVLVRHVKVGTSTGDMLDDGFLWLEASELIEVQVPEAVQLGRPVPERT